VCDGATTAVMLLLMMYVVSDYFSLPGSVSCTVLPCSIVKLWRASSLTCNASLSSWMDTFNLYPNFDWRYSVEYKMAYFVSAFSGPYNQRRQGPKNIFVVHKRKIIYRFSFFFFTSPLGLLCSKNIGSYLCSFIFSVCFSWCYSLSKDLFFFF